MVNINSYGKISALAANMQATMNEYVSELSKCNYTAEDLPVGALQKRTQKLLSHLSDNIQKSMEMIASSG